MIRGEKSKLHENWMTLSKEFFCWKDAAILEGPLHPTSLSHYKFISNGLESIKILFFLQNITFMRVI